MHVSRISLFGVALLGALVVAGCSSAATPSVPPAAGGSSGATSPGAATAIATGSSTALGTYLVGAGGMTLYVRTSDPAGGSSCTGGCATTWPPFSVAAGTSPTAGPAVTGALGTFARSDGTLQVTYNGQAIYYYAADTKPGDTGGQGAGGVWFVAPVAGKAGPASPAASASPTKKPGY
jgi:predicted lipoprotein with Yx(FWY)xxD motif